MGVERLYNSAEFAEPVELKIRQSWSSGQSQLSGVADSWRRDVVRKATSGRRGLEALMSWGPEKMLIRYNKESQHPAEWTPGPPVEHQKNEKDTT